MRRLKILKIYFVFWLFIIFIIYANFENVATFFMATLTFNVAVLTTLIIGLIIAYHAALKLTMLAGTFGILRYKKGKALEFYLHGIEKVFPTNIANMFKKRATKEVLFFTQQEIEDVSGWLEEKFTNEKVYINFFTSTALMIGLFGTFTGLLQAIDQMGSIILSLSGDINLAEVIAGFAGPLGGMAIGFASSLFGVAAAIILSIKAYILSRNQEIFLEDVEDWMKGLVLESQSKETLTMVQNSDGTTGTAPVMSGGGMGKTNSGMMDMFVDKMGDFSSEMSNYNKSNEAMFGMLTDSIDNSASNMQNEMAILENISTGLKELNINQFANANMMEESLQSISGAVMNENKTIKQMIVLQEKNNELLTKLVESLDSRLSKLENK